MTEHNHTTIVPGCYRCDLNKDEVRDSATGTIKEALREYVGDGDGSDEAVLTMHDNKVRAQALREAAMQIDWQFEVFVASDGINSIRMHGKSPGELLAQRAGDIEEGRL
jgi:hypothetical protein